MPYLVLILAVVFETIATSALQASQQFTKPLPSMIVIIGYGISFYLLSITLRSLPVGIVYALWSGLGVVSIAIIGFYAFNQRLDLPALAGMGLIITGIAVIHLFSSAASH